MGLRLFPVPTASLPERDNLLQTAFWGAFKAASGWEARGFRLEGEAGDGHLLVLSRRVGGILPLAYVPHGPVLPPEGNPEDVTAYLEDLSRELLGELPLGTLYVRYDLTGGTEGRDVLPPSLPKPLRRAPYRVQPADTVVLDPGIGEEALLAGMHKKNRYNIRLAERQGVEVEATEGEAAEVALADWYALYRETSLRQRIALHPESYYRRQFVLSRTWNGAVPAPRYRLYLARHEGELLAGIITAVHGRRATYLYGASSDRKRNLMPNYLLQWRALQDAAAEGCREYDLFGIPPTDDPGHPMHGLYRMKTGFGGRILHRYGAWDYPFSRTVYPLYRLAEAARGALAARRKRR